MKDLIKELRKGNEVCCEDCLLYVPRTRSKGLCRNHLFRMKNNYLDFAKVEPTDEACINFVKK